MVLKFSVPSYYKCKNMKLGSPSPPKKVMLEFLNPTQNNKYLYREWDKQVWASPEDTDKNKKTKCLRFQYMNGVIQACPRNKWYFTRNILQRFHSTFEVPLCTHYIPYGLSIASHPILRGTSLLGPWMFLSEKQLKAITALPILGPQALTINKNKTKAMDR